MKRKINFFVSLFLLVTLMVIPASADTASDYLITPSIYNHSYKFDSRVLVMPSTIRGGIRAFTCISEADLNDVPTGYMGGQARLFDSNGNLKISSVVTYNTSTAWYFSTSTNTYFTPGSYYACSIGKFYNGNGYNSYTGLSSPIQVYSGSSSVIASQTPSNAIEGLMQKMEFEINKNGQTYGSALSAYTIGVEPDLISAVGINGVIGYVKSDELSPNYSTIEEAIKHNPKNGDTRIIPLYDVNGTTVIGQFKLETVYETKEKK